MTVRTGEKTLHKLHAHVQDALNTSRITRVNWRDAETWHEYRAKRGKHALDTSMKTYGRVNSSSTICGVRGQLHVPAALTSGFHLIGSSLGLTMGLRGLEKRKICCPSRESKHDYLGRPARSLTTTLTELFRLPSWHDRFLCAFAKSAYYLRHFSSSAVSLSAQTRAAPIRIVDVYENASQNTKFP